MKTINNTNRILLGITILCLAVFAACSKSGSDDPTPPTEKQADVYIVGTQVIAGKEGATLWKNGAATRLSTKTSSAEALFVSGNDVYVVGYAQKTGERPMAVIWKNGEVTELTDGTNDALAITVFVAGSDVYVGGTEEIDDVDRAKVWKNGKLYYTFPKNTILEVSNIAVQDGHVYAASSSLGMPQYWINPTASVPTIVQVPELGGIYSFFVSGSDVYVGGYGGAGNRTALYMKNDKVTNLTDGTNEAGCFSMFVSGANVYAAGYEKASDGGKIIAKYWKNGTSTSLTDGSHNAIAASVFVWNDKVYVVGRDDGRPYLWEDGKPTKLPTEESINSAEATAVFVVER